MARLGFQLSSLTPYLRTPEQVKSTLARVAEMGYRNIQLQGVPTEIDDKLLVSALRDNGLTCVATQEDYPLGFGADPDRAIARAVACGSKYLACALIPKEADTPDKLKAFGEDLERIGEKVKATGMVFAFHPIGPDYRIMEGVPVFRRLMSMLSMDVQLAFCVNATFRSPCDYRDVLTEFAGRVDLVHFKDDVPGPDGKPKMTPLGEGSHDWRPILSACEQAGAKWIFAEQERWDRDAFACMEASYRYLTGIGLS